MIKNRIPNHVAGVQLGPWGPEMVLKQGYSVNMGQAANDPKTWALAMVAVMQLPEWAKLEKEYLDTHPDWKDHYLGNKQQVIVAAKELELAYRVRAEGTPTYVRFGRLPKSGRSKNHVTGEYLAGVSVYDAYRMPDGTAVVVVPEGPTWTTLFFIKDRKAYEIDGERIGTGPDGEPLLRGAKIIRQIKVVDYVTSLD